MDQMAALTTSGNCTETEYIANIIFNELDQWETEPNEHHRILLCGDWIDIEPILEYMTVNRNTRRFMRNLIVATSEIERFISEYLGQISPYIVDWKTSAYDEQLIARIKPRGTSYRITLILDFLPSFQRLVVLRKLLEKDGTLVIPREAFKWRQRDPNLLSSFSEHGGHFIKLGQSMRISHANNNPHSPTGHTDSTNLYRSTQMAHETMGRYQ